MGRTYELNYIAGIKTGKTGYKLDVFPNRRNGKPIRRKKFTFLEIDSLNNLEELARSVVKSYGQWKGTVLNEHCEDVITTINKPTISRELLIAPVSKEELTEFYTKFQEYSHRAAATIMAGGTG